MEMMVARPMEPAVKKIMGTLSRFSVSQRVIQPNNKILEG